MKIAVQTDKKQIVKSYYLDYPQEQLKIAGWQEVEADPYFNAENYSDWKVANGKLVKTTTGMSPLEELRQANLTAMALLNNSSKLTNQQQQAILNSMTIQNSTNKDVVELKQANINLMALINSQQKQIADLKGDK